MFAGLPGTGVGGIFYLLLTLWMPVHELCLLLRGRSTKERWIFIAKHWALFSGVIAAVVLQAWIMRHVIPTEDRAEMIAATAEPVRVLLDDKTVSMVQASGIMALMSLGVVCGVVYVLRAGLLVKRLARI